MSLHVRALVVGAAVLGVESILVLNVLWPTGGDSGDRIWVAGLMAFPVAAGLVLAYRPRNAVGWALATTGISAGLIFLMTWYAVEFPHGLWSREIETIEKLPAMGVFAGVIALSSRLHLRKAP